MRAVLVQKLILAAMVVSGVFAVAQPPSAFMRDASKPAAQVTPDDLKNVRIDQRLDQMLPLDLQFRDESAKTVMLGDYFHAGRPVILNLVYYTCPMLCGEELAGLSSALGVLRFTPGKEYEVVTVSFNPDDTPETASAKKKIYIDRMNERLEKKTDGAGWHFLTGKPEEIKQLADTVGFHYKRDAATGQYIHATAVMIATPQGKLAQYYYGVEYSPKDLRLGLIEASRNKIGNLVDQITLYCYHYDPNTGRYGATITNILRLGGATTMLLLGGFLIVLYRREPHDPRKGAGRA
ncbi:MAG TPA: SCO family protein [Candidatus Binatia bacterium]|nr:SCO family protein [Candidatus Binatia bacterium]